MNIKTRIKNDLWRWNYILPFVKKHQFDEKRKISLLKCVLGTYKNIRPIKGKGKKHTVGSATKAILEKIQIEISLDSHFIYFIDTTKTITVSGNILSNFPLDYSKIIHSSFIQLVQDAYCNNQYGKEVKLVADGIESLKNRIIYAIKSSKLSAPQKKHHVDNFTKLLRQPAEHFDEALQRILFFNQIMWQTRHRLNGLGHLDKILGDYYTADIEAGNLSKYQAEKLVGDFLFQLSRYAEYKSDALEGDIGQIIVLGGLNPDGTYLYNDLTEIFLREQAKLNKPDPKTFIRVSRYMPDCLLKIAMECLLCKTGSPLFSNDDIVIPALIDFGIDKDDAYDYCASACWEPFIVGKSLDQNNIAVFDYFNALDDVMANSYNTYDELVDSYINRNKLNFKNFLLSVNLIKWAKDPLVSLFTDGCNEKKVDISEGSCQYMNYGITTVAISNVIDSLYNIKRLVYEEKRYSLPELNAIRMNNYKGEEQLYKKLQKSPKHYGHDIPDTIELVNRITDAMSDVAKNYKNKYGGTVKFGLSSPGYNILSKKTNADIAGRKRGMPYNTHISCTDASYTEIVCFASKLSYNMQRFNGNVIDFFITPGFIEENIDKFILFMKGSIISGFFQMQMNVMDSKTLKDAKINPEKYAGLIVRVWGFSAYFNSLPESYKDLLIERAVAAENIL
ncbi:hypothetical protein DW886_21540 [Enterocloster aldenensis]|uniref:pyruvate formate lyase family protein n=1 Tax=Enterocloster aldenensis TaxID=358742 RepID=UPI000E4DE10A|nr:hypothetical protein DW886_21540 [Enterocloster aldenensis]